MIWKRWTHGIPHLAKKVDTWLLVFVTVWEKHVFVIREKHAQMLLRPIASHRPVDLTDLPGLHLLSERPQIRQGLFGHRSHSQALANPCLYSHVAILTVLPSFLGTHRGSLGERWKARTWCFITQQKNMGATAEDRIWFRALGSCLLKSGTQELCPRSPQQHRRQCLPWKGSKFQSSTEIGQE